MLTMKYTILLFLILFASCKVKEAPKEPLYELLDQHFLTIVDTTAYKMGGLFASPLLNDTLAPSNKYLLQVDSVLFKDSSDDNTIRKIINEDAVLFEFKEVLAHEVPDSILELNKLTSTGRYILEKSNEFDYPVIRGRIVFYKPYLFNDKVILTVLKLTDQKGGNAVTYFFKKQNGRWTIIKEELIYWL